MRDVCRWLSMSLELRQLRGGRRQEAPSCLSIDATGTRTVSTTVPLALGTYVTVIVSVPTAIAVTTPFAETVATAGALLVQFATRPLIGLSLASLASFEPHHDHERTQVRRGAVVRSR